MAEWVMKKLKDIANFNPRESLAKGIVAKKVAMDKLQPFCRDIPGYELEPFSGGTKFRNGDTIMARITPCLENGKTAKVAVLDDGEVGFGSTEYIVFRAKDGVDEDFIYYLVCSPLVREPAIKSMVGSSGRQRVQTDVVQNLEIMVPDYEEQKRISGILKSLDDKIAANTEINKNLLQQMESLYKAWFTDFIPFGGNRPADWQKSDIYSLADIIYGAPFASKLFNTDGEGIPIIRIRDLKEQAFVTYTTENHPKGHLIQPGDIVVGMDGEFRPYIWGNTEAWLNQRVCIFDNKRPKGKAFVLFTIKPLLYQIEQTQVATTVIHIGKKTTMLLSFIFLTTKYLINMMR
ncbi:type I restriction modification DNA specificity domain-containing protein [Parascardovia denticolens IPLA 20019]|uniref:restriction endonuclease subunit S n=1 Tax=Parascardovia denticolens TaxID=78258 RepID=UPI000266C0F0|nr:restriction endonuclease subunit S [Parascardovia denticolens]EIT88298.1 type I restriction modification DNA specificity domain-containing protein [Parascardovia denticolens IPLA 20019]